jgi:hypothetical protein
MVFHAMVIRDRVLESWTHAQVWMSPEFVTGVPNAILELVLEYHRAVLVLGLEL